MSDVMSFVDDDVAMTTTGQSEASLRLLMHSIIVAAIRGSSSFPSLSFPRASIFCSSSVHGEEKIAVKEIRNHSTKQHYKLLKEHCHRVFCCVKSKMS